MFYFNQEVIINFYTILLWIQSAVDNNISIIMDFISLAMSGFNVTVLTMQAGNFA